MYNSVQKNKMLRDKLQKNCKICTLKTKNIVERTQRLTKMERCSMFMDCYI